MGGCHYVLWAGLQVLASTCHKLGPDGMCVLIEWVRLTEWVGGCSVWVTGYPIHMWIVYGPMSKNIGEP